MPGAVNGAVLKLPREREPVGIEIPPTVCDEPAGNARSTTYGMVTCPALAAAEHTKEAPNAEAAPPAMETEEPMISTLPLPPPLQVICKSCERFTVVMLLWFSQFKLEPAVIYAWKAPTSAPPVPLNV